VRKATALIRESLGVAEASGDRTMLAETEWNLAQMACIYWGLEAALSHGERALNLARKLGLKELEARSVYILGLAHSFASQWEECVARASRAAAVYEALGDEPAEAGPLAAQYVSAGAPPSKELANRAMEVLCLSLLTSGEVNRGSPRAGVEAGRRAFRIAREIDNGWAQTSAMVTLNPGLVETGEYEEAPRVAREGLETARKLRYPMAICMALTALGHTLQSMLALEEAHAAYLEALAVTESIPLPPWKILIVSGLCANRALVGDWEAARRYALEAVEIRDAAPMWMYKDFERHHETEALLRSGEERLAREDTRRLGERVGQNRRFHLVHLRMLAVLDRWDGDTERAIRHLQEAEALAEEIGLPSELWQVEASMGELHEERGEPEEARGAFARAIVRELADKIGDEALREGFLGAP
jgi:tetratricopeptide (TPR) repeat protein